MVTLYRYPAPDGVVVCLDELGPLRMIPRGGRSWRRQAARRPDRYRRCGAVQLWAAFAPRRGHGVGLAVGHRTGEAILDFLRRVVLAEFPRGTIYPIWDNLSTHKKTLRLWEPQPKRVQFAWTPATSSRLNLIEAWFSVLE